jgi:cyclopropane-fatty-acyl-phospholipid synthase
MWVFLLNRMMRRIVRSGTLVIHLWDGRQLRFGDDTGTPVQITLTDPGVLRRILLNPELAIPEAYVDGRLIIANDDLHGFIALAIHNKVAGNLTRWQRFEDILRRSLRNVRQYNPVNRSRRNVAHHYDLSGKLYDLFLDPDKQYSCAYFRTPDDTLEQAQQQKKAHIAAKLLLKPGMRVLDIGCGWGGMALTLARDHGAHVLGVTLSEEQYKVANERVRAAGLQDQVEIRLMDYRDVTGRFDRIVSVGMFEHVGAPHYRKFFAHLHDLLSEDGIALVHTIGRMEPPGATSPWILKYIFPGGYVPAMSEVTGAIEKEDLWTTDIEILRLHYAETLRHWDERFSANHDKAVQLYDERFFRMWRFYLVASELTFRYARQCVFQLQLTRDQVAVPLTRDYLYLPPTPARMQRAAE